MRKYVLLCLAVTGLITARSQNNYKEISLPELMQKAKGSSNGYIILDVRTTGEYMDTAAGGKHVGIGRIKNAVNIPLQDLLQKPETIKQIEQYKQEDVYVICSHSYRSRRISNLLLQNGFTNVNNVKGGMSEWYRDYDALLPYRSLYENNISYHNIAPAQLFKKLETKEPMEIIEFRNPPRFPFDSMLYSLYPVFPDVKNAQYHTVADSLQLLEKIKTGKGKSFVLIGAIGGGSAELAEWLTKKGATNIYYLIGNLPGFFEYMANYQPAQLNKYMITQSIIKYFTPLSFCKNTPKNFQWVDIRHDTTYSQVTKGTRLEYKTLNDAINFPYYKSADEFEKMFTDKSKLYVLIPENGYTGTELAQALTKKGYRIGWLFGGIERWEWYTNNIADFKCGNELVK